MKPEELKINNCYIWKDGVSGQELIFTFKGKVGNNFLFEIPSYPENKEMVLHFSEVENCREAGSRIYAAPTKKSAARWTKPPKKTDEVLYDPDLDKTYPPADYEIHYEAPIPIPDGQEIKIDSSYYQKVSGPSVEKVLDGYIKWSEKLQKGKVDIS